MKHLEEAEQELVFTWAAYDKRLRYMHSIPNGAHLAGNSSQRGRQMARLKRQGLTIGVSDIFLPLSRGGYHGLYIELKRRKQDGPSRISKDQQDFQNYVEAQGYCATVCYGAGHAIATIEDYLDLDN